MMTRLHVKARKWGAGEGEAPAEPPFQPQSGIRRFWNSTRLRLMTKPRRLGRSFALPSLALPLMVAVSLLCASVTARAEDPSAAEILERAVMNQSSQHRVLNAVLVKPEEGTKIPFRLVLNGPEFRYEFSNPEQVFVVKLGDKSRIQEVTSEGTSRIPVAKYDARVLNTDITFEDLALRFLYWKDAKIMGEEGLGDFRCYKLELHPGAIPSQYWTVRAWVNKSSGALVKAECYDRNAVLVARFSARGVQSLHDGTWIFKTMRIERMQNGKKSDPSPTELIIKGEQGG